VDFKGTSYTASQGVLELIPFNPSKVLLQSALESDNRCPRDRILWEDELEIEMVVWLSIDIHGFSMAFFRCFSMMKKMKQGSLQRDIINVGSRRSDPFVLNTSP